VHLVQTVLQERTRLGRSHESCTPRIEPFVLEKDNCSWR